MATINQAGIIVALIAGVVGTIAGMGGLILGLLNFMVHRREQLRSISVTLDIVVPVTSHGPIELSLNLTAANPGYRPVTLNGVGLVMRDQRQYVFPSPRSDVPLPHELTEGQSCHVLMGMQVLARALITTGYSGRVKFCGFY